MRGVRGGFGAAGPWPGADGEAVANKAAAHKILRTVGKVFIHTRAKSGSQGRKLPESVAESQHCSE